MLFDDRLATVLSSPVGGNAAARTQYRQLLDLLGASRASGAEIFDLERFGQLANLAGKLGKAEHSRILLRPALSGRNHTLLSFLAYHRLSVLSAEIPSDERAKILREPGMRLRNRDLVTFLAGGDAKTAASAVATARLTQDEWVDLIPRLPMMARGFLRHRRDLPPRAKDILAQLGVRDLVLPEPEAGAIARAAAQPATDSAAPQAATAADPALPGASPVTGEDGEGIRALLRRIEAFREGKRSAVAAPRLPLGDAADDGAGLPLVSFEFTSDTEGRIDWAEADIAPLVIGMRLGRAGPGTIAALAEHAARAMHLRQPLKGAQLTVDGIPALSGEWRVDAEPFFNQAGGHFTGYRGQIRRPVWASAEAALPQQDSQADRMRQVLHELRTPVNAIQGFAEIIQQQLFGHAPNEYRALAAAVAVDAAKLLASFDEIDRLSRLETDALALEAGDADMREAVSETIRRLEGALRPRNAGMQLAVSGSPFTTALDRPELMGMVWRTLASLAGSLAPSENVRLELTSDGENIALHCELPASIAQMDDKFATKTTDKRPALSAGMFGTGFAFRLARAEFLASGGTFEFGEEMLKVNVPVLTDNATTHSNDSRDGHAA